MLFGLDVLDIVVGGEEFLSDLLVHHLAVDVEGLGLLVGKDVALDVGFARPRLLNAEALREYVLWRACGYILAYFQYAGLLLFGIGIAEEDAEPVVGELLGEKIS